MRLINLNKTTLSKKGQTGGLTEVRGGGKRAKGGQKGKTGLNEAKGGQMGPF